MVFNLLTSERRCRIACATGHLSAGGYRKGDAVERLQSADLERILDYVTGLYDLTDVACLRQRLLTTLTQLVPADRVSLIESNPKLKKGSGESTPFGAFDGELAVAYGQYLHQSPMLKAYRRGDGSAVKYSDFISQRQLHRLGLYNEYMKKLSSEYRIAKGLPGRPGWFTTVQLDRSVRDFTERDRLILNVLRPHLNQSYRNATLVTEGRLKLSQIQDGIDLLDRGLVLLTSAGEIQWMSALARRWFASYCWSGHVHEDRLPDSVVQWLKWHTELGAGELPPPREPLVIPGESAQLVVRSVRRGSSEVLLLEEQYRSVPPDALRPLGLTRREAEVLAWVAEGKSSGDIATILGTGRRAVEKHLEHIYPKLGVETRTAAAARALALLSSAPADTKPV
jgi:DNA-binding CsgD family transcriptional regulator